MNRLYPVCESLTDRCIGDGVCDDESSELDGNSAEIRGLSRLKTLRISMPHRLPLNPRVSSQRDYPLHGSGILETVASKPSEASILGRAVYEGPSIGAITWPSSGLELQVQALEPSTGPARWITPVLGSFTTVTGFTGELSWIDGGIQSLTGRWVAYRGLHKAFHWLFLAIARQAEPLDGIQLADS